MHLFCYRTPLFYSCRITPELESLTGAPKSLSIKPLANIAWAEVIVQICIRSEVLQRKRRCSPQFVVSSDSQPQLNGIVPIRAMYWFDGKNQAMHTRRTEKGPGGCW